MDIATILGITVFAGMVVITILIAEGVAGFKPFLNYEAFLVVMGGTFCSILVNYPLVQVLGLGKVLRKVLVNTGDEDKTSEIVGTFVQLATRAKKDGLLSLEGELKKITNDFLRRGLQLVIDGMDQDFIRNMLETELGFIRERHKVGQEIFNALGTYAPAFGIIGTVLGMILMLNSITDVEEVPRRMALALASAFFGLGAGYVVFLPMAGKLRRRSEEELLAKEIVIRGVLLVQSQVAPSVIEANLKAYMEPSQRLLIRTAAKPEREAA
ncbi:MAG: MotA/TolQ/ExbB proton channel family protein [Elusimicrobia bacterium]|nr:MotA/TolQ/ExbB proton channel family protein [Elusimicrobiota bacterium]